MTSAEGRPLSSRAARWALLPLAVGLGACHNPSLPPRKVEVVEVRDLSEPGQAQQFELRLLARQSAQLVDVWQAPDWDKLPPCLPDGYPISDAPQRAGNGVAPLKHGQTWPAGTEFVQSVRCPGALPNPIELPVDTAWEAIPQEIQAALKRGASSGYSYIDVWSQLTLDSDRHGLFRSMLGSFLINNAGPMCGEQYPALRQLRSYERPLADSPEPNSQALLESFKQREERAQLMSVWIGIELTCIDPALADGPAHDLPPLPEASAP